MKKREFHLMSRPAEPPALHDRSAAKNRLVSSAPLRTGRHLRETAPLYRVSDPLRVAINTSLAVGAPLLITGEPGTGKTQVAHHLGWYFDLQVFEYQVTSQSRAEDLRYDFDAVAYLRSAHDTDERQRRRPRDDFLRKRALWLAYLHAEPCVLLIDEIDKAQRDFPNDLLRELDQNEFEDPFSGEPVRPHAVRAPIVVITSNAERRLPEPFLRRCIFHHIDPTSALFQSAINAHRGELFPSLAQEQIDVALRRFQELRAVAGLRKRPSTAELLTWLAVLALDTEEPIDMEGKRLGELPGLQTLVKDADDWKRVCSIT